MASPESTNLRQYLNVEADVGITVDMQLYDKDTIVVYYGPNGAVATLNVHYTIDLNEDDFSDFVLTPLDALLTAITDGGVTNVIFAVRTLPLSSSSTPPSARNASFVSREFDRINMKLQQQQEQIDRALSKSMFDLDTSVALPPYVAGTFLKWDDASQQLVTSPLVFVGTASVDPDPSLAANSDLVVASQKATRGYLPFCNLSSFIHTDEVPNIKPALDRYIAAVKAGLVPRRLVIPERASGWTVASQVLFDLSNFTLDIRADVALSATTRQSTFLFAYDTSNTPAQRLRNVAVYGYGHVIDGNGDSMTFDYDTVTDDSAIRFNCVDGMYAEYIHATQGPIDSFSCRSCTGVVKSCEFSHSKYDNGFSATTDIGTWAYGDPTTHGAVYVYDSIAHDNEDFGMTAFNGSRCRFIRCTSYSNRAGFSYEDSFATPDVMRYDGGFYSCRAYNCPEQGIYVTGAGVYIDDDCLTYNIDGYVGDNSNNLFENGVVISNARYCYVGGEHTNNGRSGLLIANGTGQALDTIVTGRFNDNDYVGVNARGVDLLVLDARVQVLRNGLVINGQGVLISNSGGSNYNQDAGTVKIIGAQISGNGLGAAHCTYVKNVLYANIVGENNCVNAADYGLYVDHASVAKFASNTLPSTTGNQTFAFVADANVLRCYDDGNNGGSGTTGVWAQQAATFNKTAHAEFYNSKAWNPGTVNAGTTTSTTISVLDCDLNDFVSFLSHSTDIGALVMTGRVTGTNTVTVYLRNYTAGNIAVTAGGTLRVGVKTRNPGTS